MKVPGETRGETNLCGNPRKNCCGILRKFLQKSFDKSLERFFGNIAEAVSCHCNRISEGGLPGETLRLASVKIHRKKKLLEIFLRYF